MNRISIVIPVRNMAADLAECLEGMLAHKSLIHEVIIMNCCSTDGIELVIDRFTGLLPIVYFCESDRGIYDAYNKGALRSTGDLVFFMGADDRVRAGLFRAASKFPIGTDVLVGAITIGGRRERWRPWPLGAHLCVRNIPHQGMLIRRRVLEKDGYELKYRLLADYAWNLSNFWKGTYTFSFCTEVFAEWTPGGASYRNVDKPFSQDKPHLIRRHAPAAISCSYALYRKMFRLVKQTNVN